MARQFWHHLSLESFILRSGRSQYLDCNTEMALTFVWRFIGPIFELFVFGDGSLGHLLLYHSIISEKTPCVVCSRHKFFLPPIRQFHELLIWSNNGYLSWWSRVRWFLFQSICQVNLSAHWAHKTSFISKSKSREKIMFHLILAVCQSPCNYFNIKKISHKNWIPGLGSNGSLMMSTEKS